MNYLQKLHAVHNQTDTTTPITYEGCFGSYLRARFGIDRYTELLNAMSANASLRSELVNQFEKHVDHLFEELA